MDTCGSCGQPADKCSCKLDKGQGAKFDGDKLDWSLVPLDALEGMVKVMMYGAKKYKRDNWKYVEGGRHRYMNALFRHAVAIMNGENFDPESKMYHIDHLLCNAVYISWMNKHPTEEK